MKTAYLEGEGLLTEDGRFFPEARVKAALEVINRAIEWLNGLPPEILDELKRLGETK